MLLLQIIVFVCVLSTSSSTGNLPLIINTWTFINATAAGEYQNSNMCHMTVLNFIATYMFCSVS